MEPSCLSDSNWWPGCLKSDDFEQIPSNYAIAFAKSVDSNSKLSTTNPSPSALPKPTRTRYLGMKMITVTPQIIHLFNMQPWSDIKLPNELMSGSLVIEVLPNSPAER